MAWALAIPFALLAAIQSLPSAATPAAGELADHPFPHRLVEVPWGGATAAMAVIEAGPPGQPPILLLHGQPTWSYLWRRQIAGLVARGHRVIAPDLVGYGRSAKPRDPASYSFAAHVTAVTALVDALDLQGATLVVHDWGGLIGLNVAVARPGRFARLALLDTSLNDGLDPETPAFAAAFDRWLRFLETAPRIDPGAIVEAQTARTLTPAERDAYALPFPTAADQTGLRRMSALIPRRPDDPHATENAAARRRLGQWDKPVMILFSEGSERTHPGQFERFRTLFPAASIRLAARVPGARHFLMEDAPDTVTTLVDAFARDRPLAGLLAPGPASPAGSRPDVPPGERLLADVAALAALGEQRTGSAASANAAAWLERRLRDLGYAVRRIPVPVDAVDLGTVRVELADGAIRDVFPLWPVTGTAAGGLLALLAPADEARPGDVALVRLPHDPRASVYLPGHLARLRSAAARRPAALLAITDHPAGEAVALNVSDRRPFAPGIPMLVVGSRHAAALERAAAARQPVRILLEAQREPGIDWTLLAERGPAEAPALVLSTPRNGWRTAAGERATGLALLLDAAGELPRLRPDRRIVLALTSHHELGAAGMRAALADSALAPQRVSAWLHIGANAAVREMAWTDGQLRAEDGPSRHRGIVASPSLAGPARETFGRLPHVEVGELAPGRALGEVALVAAGRDHPVAGIVGWQLLHHTRLDDPRTTSPRILADTRAALLAFLERLP